MEEACSTQSGTFILAFLLLCEIMLSVILDCHFKKNTGKARCGLTGL